MENTTPYIHLEDTSISNRNNATTNRAANELEALYFPGYIGYLSIETANKIKALINHSNQINVAAARTLSLSGIGIIGSVVAYTLNSTQIAEGLALGSIAPGIVTIMLKFWAQANRNEAFTTFIGIEDPSHLC